ncbi:MAG: hypothetical protein KC652_04840 [Cyanobacteria bacterium HKST-UBA01]|nr:hypothetical protein [Cyanobacteria bacterium HKST-UBA01]
MSCFGGGVWIKKPSTTRGHHIPAPEFESSYISFDEDPDTQPDTNAPMIAFYEQGGKWVVNGKRMTGKDLAPGDFINEWETVGEAVDDIIDFYFGKAQRMNEKAQQKAKIRARIKASNDDK